MAINQEHCETQTTLIDVTQNSIQFDLQSSTMRHKTSKYEPYESRMITKERRIL